MRSAGIAAGAAGDSKRYQGKEQEVCRTGCSK